MANKAIKQEALKKHVRLWKVAEQLNMSDSMLSRYLRHELPEKEQERILSIIESLASEEEES